MWGCKVQESQTTDRKRKNRSEKFKYGCPKKESEKFKS